MKMSGGKKQAAKQQDDEQAKFLDPFAVLTDTRLKTYEYVDLKPGQDEVVIDTVRYQRTETTEVQHIVATINALGILPSVKSAVRRKSGKIAILDGGQTWRACLATNHPMSVRLYAFDDFELEASMFYVLNRVRTIPSDIRIRACDAECASFLRALNGENAFKYLFWKENGETGLSATTVLKAMLALFLPDMAPVGQDISKVMKALDEHVMPKRDLRDKTREFLNEMKEAYKDGGKKPSIVEVLALAMLKQRRGLRPFTPKHFKAMLSETKKRMRTISVLREFSRNERIQRLADIYAQRLDNKGLK